MQIAAELAYVIFFQLRAIINNNAIQNLESANDAFPYEFFNTLLGDSLHHFNFDPFGEIFTSNDDKLFLCFCYREWSEYVKASLGE